MNFIWNDGGRSTSGFVGLAGDCVTRAIAIATGLNYRDVYNSLGKAANKTVRNGVACSVGDDFLRQRGWNVEPGGDLPFQMEHLPRGVVVTHLEKRDSRRGGHFCCVIDHEIHDTWNPMDDGDYVIVGYWIHSGAKTGDDKLSRAPLRPRDDKQELTQNEFEKILKRLRALDTTASNHASTEGEKRNALRMMQSLMLRHNLSRDDITDDDNVENVSYTRMACPVNGRRACTWEKSLAAYVCDEMFPMVQWYYGRKQNRTLFWFYGPVDDVQNCIALFRELLLTIATAAQLQYGGYSRGSGASYAEGYVRGMPKQLSEPAPETSADHIFSQSALIHVRTLAVHQAALDWLRLECGISLVTTRGSGRGQHDPEAANRGKRHGSKHDLSSVAGRKRITHSNR
ncbi:DUF2786 domain-containing protein [Rhodopirellula halodulae]|uniref:DUF2786 domain-containing protein n=1 Tax=Rhodopirellula halodulae TaxID=2894198 RepID=UPI0028F3E9A5|nr:DUF2786 domain-containing protein [Rhodopirellula sp. JC737]MCC9656022.1 DUF2786 domain-containing protein [Rhodopirellula sp. JC737]